MVSVMGEHGFDVRPGAWQMPATLTAETIAEAQEQLAWVENVQLAEAATSAVRGWLLLLGNATASSSKLTPEDVKVKISAMLTLLDDYPAGVFTKASLKRAARRFRFFPGFEELAPVLDEEAKELRQKRDRLLAIARAQPVAPLRIEHAPILAATEEQKEAVRQLLDGAGLAMKPTPQFSEASSGVDGAFKAMPTERSDLHPEDDDRRAAILRVQQETRGRRRIPKPWEAKQ